MVNLESKIFDRNLYSPFLLPLPEETPGKCCRLRERRALCTHASACLCLLFASVCTTTEAIKANRGGAGGWWLGGVGVVFLLTSQPPPPSVETGAVLMQRFVNPAPLPALFSNLCSSLPPPPPTPPPPLHPYHLSICHLLRCRRLSLLFYETDRFHSSCLTFSESQMR